MDSMVTSCKPEIEIAGRKIGPAHPPLVIAEIGINHMGSLQTARELVMSAAQAGVEIVKHQTHVIDDEMTSYAKSAIPGNTDTSIYDVMSQCALNERDETELKEYAESLGLIFISTPFSRSAANRLQSLDVPAFKIGSGECNNYPLLKHIAQFRKPVILSTGMNDLESVSKAVSIFNKVEIPVAVLHTTNLYPTPPSLVRLGALVELAEAFPGLVYGLSDHTTSNTACLGAIALGASIVERHYTDSMHRTGPDIVCSMDEPTCAQLIAESNELFQMRGGNKIPLPEEQVTMDFAFSTVCTIDSIKFGEHFSSDNLWVKRPGIGHYAASEFETLLGKRAAKDLPKGIHLNKEDVID